MNHQSNQSTLEYKTLFSLVLFFFSTMLAMNAAAQPVGFGAACTNVVSFFSQFETLLRAASVIIVTIAIVFAGYQISFAHKRLSDVAPVLVGGLLIGGASAIAGWFAASWVPTGGVACGS